MRFRLRVDSKGRIHLPREVRDEVGDVIILERAEEGFIIKSGESVNFLDEFRKIMASDFEEWRKELGSGEFITRTIEAAEKCRSRDQAIKIIKALAARYIICGGAVIGPTGAEPSIINQLSQKFNISKVTLGDILEDLRKQLISKGVHNLKYLSGKGFYYAEGKRFAQLLADLNIWRSFIPDE
ncbi:hypothetical protein HRbin06_00136 [archaeon HR06]|nr:hypothetical protein HRbin06_00136 [archaeon HR06]